MNKVRTKGFTLVEMSIVLVIVGLIVSGILIGQDLIKGAQIRSTVSQVQALDAAVNTFRGKYEGMPGDLKKAIAFGVGATNGNGNGRLDDATTVVLATKLDTELAEFWVHLTAAKMLAGSFTADTTAATAELNFPLTRLKKGGILAVSEGSLNYWLVGSATTLDGTNTVASWVNDEISPAEAFGIDNKIDDGMANTGSTVDVTAAATTGFTLIGTTATGAATCWATTPGSNSDPVDYQVDLEANACTLRVRMQN